MKRRDDIAVWHEDQQVGTLWRSPSGTIGFRYHPSWIQNRGFALSRSMPVTRLEYDPAGGTAHRFFANLLPEGAVRERIVRDLKVQNTDYDLLCALGGECAGALSVGEEPAATSGYRPLDTEELERIIAHRGYVYTSLAERDRPRLSLAGAQDKIPVYIKDGTMYLSEGDAPSSHILKFESADFRNVILYEAFTMRLARAVGLPVARVELKGSARNRYLVVARYDRHVDRDGCIRRIHQEDFCQALGVDADAKYEEHGGPSFPDCLRLVQDMSTEPTTDVLLLLKWQAFNVLAGNSDGHAKNLSMLYGRDGSVRLAPFYDLVCTRAIARIDHRLALFVGGERDPGQVSRQHWEALAEACDLRPKLVMDMATGIADGLEARLDDVLDQFERLPALQRVSKVVRTQLRRFSRS